MVGEVGSVLLEGHRLRTLGLGDEEPRDRHHEAGRHREDGTDCVEAQTDLERAVIPGGAVDGLDKGGGVGGGEGGGGGGAAHSLLFIPKPTSKIDETDPRVRVRYAVVWVRPRRLTGSLLAYSTVRPSAATSATT